MAVDRPGRSPNRPEPKRDRREISRNRLPTQTPQAGRQDRSAASCDDRRRRNPVVRPSIHPKPSKVMESEMRENHQVFRRVQLRHVRVLARRALPTMTAAIRSGTAPMSSAVFRTRFKVTTPARARRPAILGKSPAALLFGVWKSTGEGGGAPKDRAHLFPSAAIPLTSKHSNLKRKSGSEQGVVSFVPHLDTDFALLANREAPPTPRRRAPGE